MSHPKTWRFRCVCFVITAFVALLPARTAHGQNTDVSRLIHPEVAEKLSLTDAQRAELQKIIQERSTRAAAATDNSTKKTITSEFDQKALQLLTEEQRKMFQTLEPLKKLKFQFRDMKWDEVLAWFAQQQDLTLVMDRIPPGSFTYMDVREYTPSEGIDLLNSVLMTRNYALMRREKMLVVMELGDSIPLELIPRVSLTQLIERGQFELVSVVFSLGGRPIEAVLNEVKPYLSNFGRAIPLAQGGQLLVVENAGKMKMINELIVSIPVPKAQPKPEPPAPPPQPVFASYPIAGLDAASALKTIQTLIPSQQITVDSKTNVLSAFVVPAQQTAIKTAIDQMVANHSALPSSNSVAYQLSGTAATELVKHLKALVPDALVLQVSDRVLVSASPEQQRLIREDLAKLEMYPVEQGQKSIRFFELPTKLLTTVESSLKAIFPGVQIAANPTAGNLVVRASAEDIALISEILEGWKRAASDANLTLKSFALDRPATTTWLTVVAKIAPNATTWLRDDGLQLTALGNRTELESIETNLASLIEQIPKTPDRQLQVYNLTKSQIARRPMLSELPKNLENIKLLDGKNKGELYVWANAEQHTLFRKLLESIDIPIPVSSPKVPRSYPIDFQNHSLVQQILVAEFADATITIDSDGKLLTAVADVETQTNIATRLALFSESFPKKSLLRLENYSVKGMTVDALQTTLTPLLTGARVNVDAKNNRLLVTTDDKTHAEIAKLIAAIQGPSEPSLQKVAIVYPLDHAKATQVKTVVDQLSLGVSTVADDSLRQVVATGTIEDHAVIKAMIHQMDRPSSANSEKQIRSFDTKRVSSAYLLPVLQKLWPEMEFSSDPANNRVIASGNAKQLADVSAAMDRLMASPDGTVQTVKSYSVPSGDMLTLPVILGQIAPQAILSSDVASRTVTVWANEEQHVRVAQAIEQISRVAQNAKKPMSYRVSPVHATPIQAAIQILVPTVNAAVVGTSGQIVVVGSEDQHRRVAEIVEMLSKELDQSNRMVKVFKIDPDEVDQAMLLSVLQSTTPTNIRLESNLVTHTIMVVGTAEEVATVGKKIDELQKEIPNLPKKTLRQYPLHANDSTTLLSILKGAHPNATIVADLAQKSLFITANDKEHEEIGAWIKTYDLPRDPVFLPIKPRTSTSVIASLKSLYPGATMTLDTTANRVMVLADPASQKRIAESIQVLEAGLDTGEKTARVFRIDPDKHDVLAISTHLRTLIPAQIQLEPNTRSASILALGNESELELVQQKLEMLQQQMVLTATATAVVYKVQNAPRESVRGINTVISSLYKDINSYSDPTNGTIVVTATEAQHKKIADIIEGYDQSTVDIETRVFNLSKADASSLRTSMAEANPRVSVTADRKTNSLIVTAPKSELERIEKTIQNIESSNENPMTTQTYRLMSSEPTSLARALDESYPNASITADATNGAIYVAATPQEHEAIKKLVDELNLQPSNQSNFKIATLKYANPESLAKSITAALGPRSRLNVSTLKESRSLFAFGSQADLRAFEQLIQELDKPQQSGSERQFETFPLKGVDGISIVSSLTKLLSGADEPADLKYDQLNGRLMAAGTADQIVKIKEALSKFEAPKREFDIFPLKTIDSFTFRTAADALFEQESGINPPTINVDSSLQQVLVHGTREQLDRIQQLLDQMGAGSKSVLRDKGQGGVRFIPINRNPQALLENVERLWPLIRANPVQIIDPKKIPKGNLENPQSNHPRSPWGSRSRLVAFQDPAETATQPASPTQEAKRSQPIDRTSTEPKADNAPVIVITGDEQWTVASDDAEALSQFENLLDTLLNPRVQPYANAGNFGVYILRHADATEARELLMDLFGISTQRSSFFSSSMQRLKIVADPRINALVIGGNLAERKTAEELLAVIDSQDLIDRLQQITPSILPLQTANAKNVLDIVKDVYKSQLSSGAGRKPLPIPDGVSTEVATMFQQINAASSGPLLAVSLDPTSNSLVIRGPSDLTQELIKFIEEIDRQAEVAPSQKIQVLRLESANAANLEKALRLLYSKQ